MRLARKGRRDCHLPPITPPADLNVLEKVEVVYETLPGWESDITGCRKFEELPENCQKYVKFIEDFLGVKIQVRLHWVSSEGCAGLCGISYSGSALALPVTAPSESSDRIE